MRQNRVEKHSVAAFNYGVKMKELAYGVFRLERNIATILQGLDPLFSLLGALTKPNPGVLRASRLRPVLVRLALLGPFSARGQTCQNHATFLPHWGLRFNIRLGKRLTPT
jgi:hypothetical protein